MKTTIFALCVLCLLCATSAFAQNATVLSNTPQVTQMSEHPQHAEVHSMAQETTLLGPNPYTYARGETPSRNTVFLPCMKRLSATLPVPTENSMPSRRREP